MKLKKVCALLMTALLCTVSVLGNTQAESRSNDLVVFVSGSSGNNSNPGTLESPKQTFGGAVALFSAKGCGGTIVVVDDINVGPWVATKLPGKVTVTSRYNGVDYRAKMNFGATGKKRFWCFSQKWNLIISLSIMCSVPVPSFGPALIWKSVRKCAY